MIIPRFTVISTTMLLCITGLLASCNPADLEPLDERNDTYLVLGHTYQHHSTHENNRIDHRLEMVDFSKYAGILLGGDNCSATTVYEHTLDYLDDIFDLANKRTLWSLGNHDVRNGNTSWISDRTERPLFYTTYFDNVQWLVLFTPFEADHEIPDICEFQASQWQLIASVLDTVQHAANLVILAHYVWWGNVERAGMRTGEYANAEKSYVNLVCDSVKYFDTDIYPLLVDVAERGLNISVISGDGGQRTKQYRYKTNEGIEFFITGINNSVDTLIYPPGNRFNFNPDSVLELKIDDATGILEHEFVPLTKIIE